jgi:hypothetical protein
MKDRGPSQDDGYRVVLAWAGAALAGMAVVGLFLELEATHRRVVGLRLAEIRKLLGELLEFSPSSDHLNQLDDAVREIADEVGAVGPRTPTNTAPGLLMSVLVLSHELRPRALKAYGPLSPEAADYFERQSERLQRLISPLLDSAQAEQEEGR